MNKFFAECELNGERFTLIFDSINDMAKDLARRELFGSEIYRFQVNNITYTVPLISEQKEEYKQALKQEKAKIRNKHKNK